LFLARPSDDTTRQEKTVVGSRSSRILVIDPICIKETIKNIAISLMLILDAEIGNTFDVMQGAFNSLPMLGARSRKKLNLGVYSVCGVWFNIYTTMDQATHCLGIR